VDLAAPSSSPVADNVINVEELVEPIDQPRRNPKRKCKSVSTRMDDSISSYPTQERMKSTDGHEEAPEPSEMTWTLSQLIRKIVGPVGGPPHLRKLHKRNPFKYQPVLPFRYPKNPLLDLIPLTPMNPIQLILLHSAPFIQTQLITRNSAPIVTSIQLIPTSTLEISLLPDVVQTITPINSIPLFKVPRSSHMHLAPHHSQDKTR
jgi:hypothetical protein